MVAIGRSKVKVDVCSTRQSFPSVLLLIGMLIIMLQLTIEILIIMLAYISTTSIWNADNYSKLTLYHNVLSQ